MNITFYQNASDPMKMDKSLTSLGTIQNCVMRDSLNIKDPVFRVASAALPGTFNYVYCDLTDRYYFTEAPVMLRTGLWDIPAHVDLLSSYKQQLRAKTATIARNENLSNGYLIDGNYKAYAYRECMTRQFPNAMDQDSLVMITVG